LKTIKKFKVDKEYLTSSVCDHNCIFKFKIVRRTEKSVWITGSQIKKETRKGLYIYNEAENFKPFGSYSMAPIIRA